MLKHKALSITSPREEPLTVLIIPKPVYKYTLTINNITLNPFIKSITEEATELNVTGFKSSNGTKTKDKVLYLVKTKDKQPPVVPALKIDSQIIGTVNDLILRPVSNAAVNDAGGDDLTELKAKSKTNKANVVNPLTTEKFLVSILPELAQGERWCAVSIKGGKSHQTFHDTIKGLLNSSNEALTSSRDSYYSMATYEQPSNGNWNRKKESVRHFKSLWIDLDCLDNTAYPTQTDGLLALKEFTKKTKLPQPTLVSSGYGIHAYFTFNEAIPLIRWTPLAQALMARIGEEGFAVKDLGVSGDAARILRVPETVNYKNGFKKDVKLLCIGTPLHAEDYERLLNVNDIEQPLAPDALNITGTKPSTEYSLNATTTALMGFNDLPDNFECNNVNKNLLRKASDIIYQRDKIPDTEETSGFKLPNVNWFSLVCAFKTLITLVAWPEDEAFNLFDEVCKQMGGYDAAGNRARWEDHKPRTGSPTTYKTLLRLVRSDLKAPTSESVILDDGTELHWDMKKGKRRAGLNNIIQALGYRAFSRVSLSHDIFRDRLMYTVEDDTHWKPLTDAAYTELRALLHNLNFEEISARLMIEAVKFVAVCNRFDSAINWLNGLVWDGIPRVETFNPVYFNTPDTEYTRAVGKYMWSGMAARIFDGGCQCDMVPVYVGDQGAGKSTGIMSLAPETDMATEISFLDDEDKTTRKMRGTLIAEISELKGINTKDEESIKAFLTRRYDRIKPLYAEFTVDIPRRCMFIGTTNKDDILNDETGNRRWLPMVSGAVDRDKIILDREQLWAEAASIYRSSGICWQDAARLAPTEHTEFMIEDIWLPKIAAYLREYEGQKFTFDLTSSCILIGALALEVKHQNRGDEMRVGKVMRALGYKKTRLMVKGLRLYVWVK